MASHFNLKIHFCISFPYTPTYLMCFFGSTFFFPPKKEFVYLPRVFPQVLLLLDNDKYHSQLLRKIVLRVYLHAISCLSVCRRSQCEFSHQIRSRCVYEGFNARILCFRGVDSFSAANFTTLCHYH